MCIQETGRRSYCLRRIRAYDPGVTVHVEQPAQQPGRVDVRGYDAAGELVRALTAPVRLAIIDLLADRSLCVHELVDALAISQPLVSQHLRVLRGARLVSTERRGREVVYGLADRHVAHIVRDAVKHAGER
jgi:DNA-binding transcriptional ArsR family regulator